MMKALKVETFDDVFDALADSPEQAANWRVRAELSEKIRGVVIASGWTQAEAARRCKIAQPRMNDLLHDRISKFSLDALVNIAAALGWMVELHLKAA